MTKSYRLLAALSALVVFAASPAGWETITPQSLSAHVSFLASDAMEGRETGTPSADVAAEYVASRFRAAGLEPAADALPPGVVVTPLAQTSAAAHPPGQPASRYTLMALATRNAQAASAEGAAHPTLLVAGDSDFAVNRHFATLGNGALFTNAVTLLAGEDALLTIRPRHYENRRVELTNRQMRAVFWTSTVALPLLALLTGLLLWWRRR